MVLREVITFYTQNNLVCFIHQYIDVLLYVQIRQKFIEKFSKEMVIPHHLQINVLRSFLGRLHLIKPTLATVKPLHLVLPS